MNITNEACAYLQEQAKEFANPILVVIQRVYRGWCGTEVVNVVAPADEEMIQDKDAFEVKKTEECKFPIYIDKRIGHLWGQAKIDLAGWAAFKRLVLVEN